MKNGALLPIRDEIGNAIAGMFLLSESEAPLELLPAAPEPVSQAIFAGSLGPDKTVMSAANFLQQITDSVDPGDEGLQQYLQQWKDLFAILQQHTDDICVYRSGSDPVTIHIAAIIDGDAIVIRTTAVET